MAEFWPGDRVQVNISAGIVPGAHPEPDWQPGTVTARLPDGMYRVRLDAPISGRTAEKDATEQHIRPL